MNNKKNKNSNQINNDSKIVKITFSLFIQSLMQQSLMALGLIPWPDSGLIKPKIKIAKEMLDILAILQKKTKGNLTDQEDKILKTILYQLRIAYIEKEKKITETV